MVLCEPRTLELGRLASPADPGAWTVPEAAALLWLVVSLTIKALQLTEACIWPSGCFQVGHPQLRTGPAPESAAVARASPGASPATAFVCDPS